MKNTIILKLIIPFLLCFSACGTSQNASQGQPQRPMESYEDPLDVPPAFSAVNIPIRLNAQEIERLLNTKMNGVIYEDNNVNDDGIMMKATKTQDINIKLEGFQMTYRVPMKIWMFKSVIGSRGFEAEGELALLFKTNVNIKPDWWMWTNTDLVGQEWIRNMAVKTGLGNIDVKYIADMIINRSRQTLTTAIDKQVTQNFQIRPQVEEAWNLMQKPVSIASSYGTWWVKLTPQSVEMAPFSTSGDVLVSNIAVQSLAEVVAGATEPRFRPNTQLPMFKVGAAQSDDFQVNLSTDIALKEAETLAKSVAVGTVLNPGGKKIQITDIQLFGQVDKVIINTVFSGDYKGSLYLVGRPVLDVATNSIKLEDVDYDLNTKNFLLKGATWLFDKKILTQIKSACVFPLDDNLKGFQQMMNDQIREYKVNNNVAIKGYVEQIKVDDIRVLKDKFKIYVSSKGKLNVDVSGLDKF
jgi:Domain of unknown function (DUF4403)